MEKITIKEIKAVERPGKTKFWSCECPNGSKYTVWDENIANVIGQNLNIECEAETKQAGNFWNIRAFVGSNVTPQAERVQETQQPIANAPSARGTNRDNIIVAQCMLKVEFRNHADPKPLDILESYRFYLKELNE